MYRIMKYVFILTFVFAKVVIFLKGYASLRPINICKPNCNVTSFCQCHPIKATTVFEVVLVQVVGIGRILIFWKGDPWSS